MRRTIFSIVLIFFIFGCSSQKRFVLTESEQYYFIPAGTEFHAVIVKGQKPVAITRSKDTWAVDAGYLAELQEQANSVILNLR